MSQELREDFECKECGNLNYQKRVNHKINKNRLEMMKYCKHCRKMTLHKETK